METTRNEITAADILNLSAFGGPFSFDKEPSLNAEPGSFLISLHRVPLESVPALMDRLGALGFDCPDTLTPFGSTDYIFNSEVRVGMWNVRFQAFVDTSEKTPRRTSIDVADIDNEEGPR
jgi:hypothetical protein